MNVSGLKNDFLFLFFGQSNGRGSWCFTPSQPVRLYQGDRVLQGKCFACLTLMVGFQKLRVLPCQHQYHTKCVDPWLVNNRTCPLCKLNIIGKSCKISYCILKQPVNHEGCVKVKHDSSLLCPDNHTGHI